MKRISLIFEKPFEVGLREETLPKVKAREVLVKTQFSAISPGTEMLVYQGQMPFDMPLDANIKTLAQTLRYPLKYGYTAVGEVIGLGSAVKKDWLHRKVFGFHPHESYSVANPNELIPIPADIDPQAALFLSNMETAVNFVMDGRPLIGECVVVLGQGIVGLLTTALLAQFPLTSLVTLDRFALRRQKSLEMGASSSLDPHRPEVASTLARILSAHNGEGMADLVYEVSGNPEALNQAVSVAGFGARIVIGSWYGAKQAHLDLGRRFHRHRIQLRSSQVSTLAPELTGRWTKTRRFAVAWDMIRRVQPTQLITQRFPISRARQAFERLDQKPEETVQIVLVYDD
ncbi:MAG: zinc-binding dehydrogenase [Desulfobacterales bacterium]|nr:MAG: zinc-binding dehydrogenase [Desulfobacterales bacterium]